MSTIFDYIATMDAAAVDNPTGDGFGVFPLFTGTGTGTSGVVGIGTIPALTGDGTADWAPIGIGTIPALTGMGTTDGYRPAWGAADIPAMTGDGTAHVLIESRGLLPPLFGTGATGAIGDGTIPSMTGYAVDDSFNTTADGIGTIPALTGEAYVCGLTNPINTAATSAAVVHLLQQGSITIADAAATICAGLTTQDAMARAIIRAVADLLTYVPDGDGIGDTWMCAIATLQKEAGDCEDGAILAHSLMLAAGIDPGRIRTAFGTVMTTSYVEAGHAWVMYRRMTDEEWIPLDWTRGSTTYAGTLTTIARQADLAESYTGIDYILTNERFYAVTQPNYIANLAANHATGSGTIVALTGTGQTSIAAVGSAALAALLGSGHTGAHGAGELSSLMGTGSASTRLVAWGAGVLPVMVGDGATGAVGDGTIPKLKGTGQCGLSAKGAGIIPAMLGTGHAEVENLCHGAGTLPHLIGAGRALVGSLGVGSGVIPSMQGTGHAAQGPIAHGEGKLPRLTGTGVASQLSVATGNGEIAPLIGHGHAVTDASWVGILAYDETRLS